MALAFRVVCTCSVEPEELTAIGLYDPLDPNAGLRLELLNYVTSLGATTDELVTFKDSLPALAGVLSIRGGPALTLEEAAARSGLTSFEVRALVQAAGIPDPEPDVPVFTERFVEFISKMGEVRRRLWRGRQHPVVASASDWRCRVSLTRYLLVLGQRRTRCSTRRSRRSRCRPGQRGGGRFASDLRAGT